MNGQGEGPGCDWVSGVSFSLGCIDFVYAYGSRVMYRAVSCRLGAHSHFRPSSFGQC